jgi:hypothetical protein
MPLGEFIVELGLRLIFEIVFYGITYWTGFVILKLLTLGSVRVAPFSTVGDKNRGRWIDWSFYLHTSYGRVLKMETVCLVGMVFWILVGVLTFFALRGESP